ncbi:MAG TPA: cytochrome c oxidase assembly factor CtaG [Bacillus bacterium]|nr:cytochrome c oxidase assembly factor CtaG [Bacillus sp. (in: firmicutes)]
MLEKLSIFGFKAMWSPWFLISLIVIGAMYFLLVRRVTEKQAILFITSLVLLYIVKGSPVDLLGHLNFSIHMAQMSVLYLVLPPLLIHAIPNWLYQKVLAKRYIRQPFLFVTKPLFAVLLFNGVFSLYHFPFIFDAVKTNIVLHALVTTTIFIAALIMWWPLICPLSEYRKLSGLQKLAYIFADGVLLTPACALIIFSDVPLYQTYTNPVAWAKALELCVPVSMLSNIDIGSPQMFSWLPPLHDQQLGGVIMKIMQEISYGTVLTFVFFQWVKEEKQKESKEAIALPSPQP